MIKVRNLTKVYKDRHKNNCIAVNSVSFDLPDKGLIFVIGKSGSGKSTLLNMLGGLDTPTIGDINADGNLVSKFNKKELNKYRSSYVSFIFQDYHVIEDLTVFENVRLTLDLDDKHNDALVKKIIRMVGLDGLEERYPRELSGGQKQRIAVARALVKENSRVILCDEPTGNLDKETTKAVLHLLKEISETKLVVVVSHNLLDAEKYADRIIRLFDGKITEDYQRVNRTNREFEIKNNVAYLPHFDDLDDSMVEEVNQHIKKRGLTFKQIGNKFVKTKEITDEMKNVEISQGNASKEVKHNLFNMVFKRSRVSLFISAFLCALIFTCFAMLQSFISFDAQKTAAKCLKDNGNKILNVEKGTMMKKGYLDTSSSVKNFRDDDIKKFAEAGYTGNIYYKYPLSIHNTYVTRSPYLGTDALNSNLAGFYIKCTLGVVNCDLNYLKNIFGNDNNDVELLAGNLDGPSYGVYITDFEADSIKFYNNQYKDYNDLIGLYKNGSKCYQYINGVINTNYKERFKDLKAIFDEFYSVGLDAANKIATTLESEEYLNFAEYVNNYLGIAYSLSPTYIDDYIDYSFEHEIYLYANNFQLINESRDYKSWKSKAFLVSFNENLKGDEITVPYGLYNEIFGTNFGPGKTELPFDTFVFRRYNNNSSKNDITLQKTFKVKAITDEAISISKECFRELFKSFYSVSGLMFDNLDKASTIIDTSKENDYIIYSAQSASVSMVQNVICSFKGFFIFAMSVFLILTLIYIITYTVKIIRKNKYDIGILKAIGANEKDINSIFKKEILIFIVSLFILSMLGIFLGTFVANLICIDAFEKILEIKLFGINLVVYKPLMALIDCILLMIVTILASLFSLRSLYKVNPIEIIKAKE